MGKINGELTLLRNSGYTEPVYDIYKKSITKQNSRMVKTTSFIGSIIMIVLTVTALFMQSVSKVFPLYLVTAILFMSIYTVTILFAHKNSGIALVCSYAFIVSAFFFALGLDVIQKNPTATTICVLLVALPLLIVDKPYREVLFFAIISIAFMIETVYIKKSPKASIDVLNSASFFVIGIFLGYRNNQMIIKNIMNQRLLENQRDTDPLTSLYNKGAIENKVVEFLSKMNVSASMIVIDMDNFKFVNDTYGHKVGDELLVNVGKVLMSTFRSSDIISRFGGDEFVVFLPMTDNIEVLKMKADMVLTGVEQIRLEAAPDYRAHLCIGIASYPDDGGSYEELFKNADAAMYEVKKNGKNSYRFYDENTKSKILLVDDIETNRVILKTILEPEFEVLEAEDGEKALNILEKNRNVAMVITDMQMPNMDDFVYKPSSPGVIHVRVKNVLKMKSR